ncbi:UDP-N-acetylmuramoyl-tripeptide--D-alanyl-D-alanine ligase [Paenibacillus sp. IB182496]|uniref:UDP-N-acetylmuramoyl-tripeptide--D-alanyl-D-alanine ligase n=1 Tax=Paenibacillus sabuli TaxID=2772509 RepID=A0A927BRG3_9BACL|nr:UDP-N-acetylmuramoyl-tripeptide--D-alanyl-D-alanine ligase [Paenibacillus sabuli]MBD2844400.1 UDP-N-acetylmuramoyl-tripeptide--D-alanyl-D-alanine ligase [Paenibacillus sabuli]
MRETTIGALAERCEGALRAGQSARETLVTGVSTDTRTIRAGELFVPLTGENHDGHDHAERARAAGAAGTLWRLDRPVPEALADWPLILVENPLTALQRLAAAYRASLTARVVAITGSNGKTTTKDMTAAALQGAGNVRKTAGNLNNHIGLPLTILQTPPDTDTLVLELGMSDYGEIALLTAIARPDVAIVTNIGEAHLLQLGSRAGIAQAKLEIAQGLQPGGLLLYNGDEPLLREAVPRLMLPEGARAQSFGCAEDNDWVALDMEMTAYSSTFRVRRAVDGQLASYAMPVPGRHNVLNATAAIAAAQSLGEAPSRIQEGFAGLRLSAMRIEQQRAFNGALVLNDAYNASPTAMRACIDLVESLDGFDCRWLVLGDMLELGSQERELHEQVGAYLSPAKAERVLAYGPLSRHLIAAAAPAYPDGEKALRHFADKAALSDWLKTQLQPEDLVLVKGSRGMRMEHIVQAICAQ